MTESIKPDQLGMSAVPDLDTFVYALTKWHTKKVQELEYFLNVPEGVEVTVTGRDGSEATHVLQGDLRAGFLIGLELALMNLGSLPFAIEYEEPVPGNDGSQP